MEALLQRRTPPTFTEIDHPRVSAMRCSERVRELSLLMGHHHKVSMITSDTRLGNRARVSKPIEITDRGILVCHQRRRKHPSCVRLAPRRDADNLERPRWFFARVQGELLPPAHPQRLERPTSYGGHVIRGARVCFCLMLFVNCCTLSLELFNYHPVRGKTAST